MDQLRECIRCIPTRRSRRLHSQLLGFVSIILAKFILFLTSYVPFNGYTVPIRLMQIPLSFVEWRFNRAADSGFTTLDSWTPAKSMT